MEAIGFPETSEQTKQAAQCKPRTRPSFGKTEGFITEHKQNDKKSMQQLSETKTLL
jgi:hypothetical protein